MSLGCELLDNCCKCPETTTTMAVGTVEAYACMCVPGHDGSACGACTEGKYKSNVGKEECLLVRWALRRCLLVPQSKMPA